MKKRYILGLVVALGLIVAARIGFGRDEALQNQPSAPAAVTTTKPAEVARNRLEIEAIKARQYPGGDIKTEQDLGQRGNSHDYVASYLSDGLTIYALMSVPLSAKPTGGWPVIIFEHGYIAPSAYQTDGPEYKSWISELTRAGYMVIKPDYRGHGRSQGTPEGGHWSPAYAYDVLNLIASVKRYSEANASKIGQLGHSLGGHVALRTAVVSSDVRASVFAAGVVGSAEDLFYNWPRSPMSSDQPQAVIQGFKQKLIDQYGDPHQNPDFWSRVSAVNYVGNITGAVQINHGTTDATVPKLFSDHLDANLKAAAKPDEYWVYEGGDHQFSAPGVHGLFLQRVVAFFDRTLK